jgi:serine/arginine repetitive matrix protein 2
MTPTPTPVDQIQTKRMVARQNSTGDAARGRGRASLQRRDSSGSMTERTFRASSPGSQPTQPAQQHPPVPSIPAQHVKTHRRAASADVQSPRNTMVIPVKPSSAQRPQSQIVQKTQQAQTPSPQVGTSKPSRLQKSKELERTDSQGSLNYSYPNRVRPNSPPPASPISPSRETADPHATLQNGISAMEAENIRYNLINTAATCFTGIGAAIGAALTGGG